MEKIDWRRCALDVLHDERRRRWGSVIPSEEAVQDLIQVGLR